MFYSNGLEPEAFTSTDLESYLERPVVLLGGGQLGKLALEMWPTEKLAKPICILDKSPHAGSIARVKCELREKHKFAPQNTYVLSFFKEQPKEIIAIFLEINQPIITVYDVLTHYKPHLFSNGWLGKVSVREEQALLGSFEDPKAKQIIMDVIRWRAMHELSLSYCVDSESDKYNIPDYALKSDRHFDLVIDGGSFDAGFLKTLDAQQIGYGAAILVEPDPVSVNSTKKYVSANSLKNVEVCSAALFENTNNQLFNANGLLCARIIQQHCDHGSAKYINCTTLSSILKRSAAGRKTKTMRVLIKLHLEGVEWQVVRESVETLKFFGEVLLFINLSHDRDSFIKIPPFLKSRGFKLSLHSHSLFGEGLTLTAYRKN